MVRGAIPTIEIIRLPHPDELEFTLKGTSRNDIQLRRHSLFVKMMSREVLQSALFICKRLFCDQ
jgi:hypothetical protein